MGDGPASYPWERLERVPRDAVDLARRARRAAPSKLTVPAVSRALSELLSADVQVLHDRLRCGPRPEHPHGTTLGVRARELSAWVWVESDLEHTAVLRALSKKPGLAAPDRKPDAAIEGALAAILVETVRRSSEHAPVLLRDPPATGVGLHGGATVFVDDKPYHAAVWLCPTNADTDVAAPASQPAAAGTDAATPASLAAAGDLPVTLPLVAANCAVERDEVAALSIGDVFAPDAWWAAVSTTGIEGHVVLAAPGSERGLRLDCSEGARLVVTGVAEPLSADEAPGAMAEPTDTIAENALDVPVVVRVEIASVTLTAREWAELRAGDVIETPQRIAEPVVLRVAGREIARGELVNVDGSVGVRIREILGAGESR